MSAAGPELPPHLLAKRKRQLEEEEKNASTAAPGAKRAKSPPKEAQEERSARSIGPAPPPAPLDERPTEPLNNSSDEDSSDDDDFGPALPSSNAPGPTPPHLSDHDASVSKASTTNTDSSSTLKRADWMMVPPKQDDLAARLDPNKPRPRGFNTGKSARDPSGSATDNGIWTETPEQKRKRLEDQVMGVKSGSTDPASESAGTKSKQKEAEDRERAAKIKESRGKSLYEMHQANTRREKDDDPSQREFDREKDIGGGQISEKQRRALMNNAAGFNSKFSSGSFL